MRKLLIIMTISLILGLMAGPVLAISFKFDFQHLSETPDPNGTEGLLLREQTVKIDIYLTDWVSPPNVRAIDYFFTWDPGALDVVDVTLVTADEWTEVYNDLKAPGVLTVGVLSYQIGVCDVTGEPCTVLAECTTPPDTACTAIPEGHPGPDMLLHTVEIRGINIPQWNIDIKATLDDPTDEIDGVIWDVDQNWYEKGEVDEAQGKIHSICREHSFECSEDNPCDKWQAGYVCRDEHVVLPDFHIEDDTYELIDADPPFCRGDTVNVKHNYIGSFDTEEDLQPESLCDSECYNTYFDLYLHYNNIPDCFYQCIEEDDSGYCDRLEDECSIIDAEVTANDLAYNQCYGDYGSTVHFDMYCGLPFEEGILVRVREPHASDCEGTVVNDSPILSGVGMGGIDVTLPLGLTPGTTYDICAEVGLTKTLVGEVQIATSGCPSESCTIQIPHNPFKVEQQGTTPPTFDIALEADDDVGTDSYTITMEHSVDLPDSLQLHPTHPEYVTVDVVGGVGTIVVQTDNPQPENGQNYWANLLITAEKDSDPTVTCQATFDYEIEALSANENCDWDDEFSLEGLGSDVCGGAAQLGLTPDTTYSIYVMQQPWGGSGANLSTSSVHDTSFTTNTNGNMECNTVIWESIPTPTSLPADFDIVIDANNNGVYDPDDDVIDSFTVPLGSDGDGVADDEDNCPDHANGPARGTCTQILSGELIVSYIPSSCTTDEDCGPGKYCEMEQADNYPTPPNGVPNGVGDACECESDFNCDTSVDGLDVTPFLAGLNKRLSFSNPCTNEDPCKGDFNCDTSVVGSDALKFIEDWNKRLAISNPCPPCNTWVPWCDY